MSERLGIGYDAHPLGRARRCAGISIACPDIVNTGKIRALHVSDERNAQIRMGSRRHDLHAQVCRRKRRRHFIRDSSGGEAQRRRQRGNGGRCCRDACDQKQNQGPLRISISLCPQSKPTAGRLAASAYGNINLNRGCMHCRVTKRRRCLSCGGVDPSSPALGVWLRGASLQ
jgi:hypothetical protein